jgi:hypothetical protein
LSTVISVVRSMGREPPILRIRCARCARRYVTRSPVAKVASLKGCQGCRRRPKADRILAALAAGPRVLRDVEAELPDCSVRPQLTRLKGQGLVDNDGRGTWWLA